MIDNGTEGTADDAGHADAGTTEATDAASAKPETKVPEKSEFQKRLAVLRGETPDPAVAADDDDDKDPADAAKAPAKPGDKPADKPGEKPDPKKAAVDDESQPLTVSIPGRKADDPDVVLPLDRVALKVAGLTAADVTARINQLKNGYARKADVDALTAKARSDRAELDGIAAEMCDRPVEFITDRVQATQFLPLATALIARLSDAEFDALARHVAEFDAKPETRTLKKAESIEARVTRREADAAQRAREQKREGFVAQVAAKITDLIPEDMDAAQAQEFYELATFKLTQWGKRQPAGAQLDPDKVPQLLSELGALTPFGLTLDDGTVASPATPPAKKPATGTKTAVKPSPSTDTGKDLKDRHDRRVAAATTPAGAGAAAATSGPPKGQSFKERMAWFRKS